MKKLKAKHFYIILAIAAVGILFWWFQVRPSQIRADCHETAVEKAKVLLKTKTELYPSNQDYRDAAGKDLYIRDDYDSTFKSCLNSKGLK